MSQECSERESIQPNEKWGWMGKVCWRRTELKLSQRVERGHYTEWEENEQTLMKQCEKNKHFSKTRAPVKLVLEEGKKEHISRLCKVNTKFWETPNFLAFFLLCEYFITKWKHDLGLNKKLLHVLILHSNIYLLKEGMLHLNKEILHLVYTWLQLSLQSQFLVSYKIFEMYNQVETHTNQDYNLAEEVNVLTSALY